jgi:hypothetical protein
VATQAELEKLARYWRGELLRQVRVGLMEPEQAEYTGPLYSVGELSRAANPNFISDDDLLSLEFWTMAMAVAWLAWERVDAVRECHRGYASTRRGWVRLPNTPEVRDVLKQDGLQRGMPPGYILDDGAPASISGMIAREKRGLPPLPGIPSPKLSVFNALSLLVAMLVERHGSLVAYADHQLSGQTDALPAAAWETLAWGPRRLPPGFGVTWSADPKENAERIDYLYTDDALIRVAASGAVPTTPTYTSPRLRRVELLAATAEFMRSVRQDEPRSDMMLIAQRTDESIDVGPAFEDLQRSRRHRALRPEGQAIHDWFMSTYGQINDAVGAKAKGENTWGALANKIDQAGKQPGGKGVTVTEANMHQFLNTMRERGTLSAKPS